MKRENFILNDWLKKLGEELSADIVILMDKRGFIIARYTEYKNEDRNVSILSNVLLSIDSYLDKYFKRELNYIFIEGSGFYLLLYRFTVNNTPYYLSMFFLNEISPLGLILMRLENIAKEFRELISREILTYEQKEDINLRDMSEILNRLERNPLYKLLLDYMKNNLEK